MAGALPVKWDEVPSFGERPASFVIRPSAYAVISDDAGRIAIVHSAEGAFLPGGGVEAGESAEDAIGRESMEECGFTIEIGAWRAHAIQYAWSPVAHVYYEKRCTFADAVVRGVGEKTDADATLEWVSVEDALRVLAHEAHAWAVERAFLSQIDQ